MEIQPEHKIKACKNYLKTLTGAINDKHRVLAWFQVFCQKLSELLLAIADRIKKQEQPLSQDVRETMLLYLLQLNTALSVLINIFMTESESLVTITEARNCITRQITLCLDGLEGILHNQAAVLHCGDGFVKHMDAALDKLAAVDIEDGPQSALNEYGAARKVVEEVLCYAMSIAQVALNEDSCSIKGSSREVLSTLESICNEITSQRPNTAMCNLFIDSSCDKLCALERKVNTAVLKLSLKVFSECTKPLEDLHQYCLKPGKKNEETLDELIAEFDMHVDRMIQVGLFAVSCSTDRTCTLKLRNCLASLEVLEGELVPALSAMHIDPSPHNLYLASVLKHYWIKQALTLKKHIYLIIDPFAFCQVTYEVIKDINEELENKFKTIASVDKNLVKPITLQTKILYEMLAVSLKDSPPENQDVIKKYLSDVINVTMEIDAAAEQLLNEKDMCKDNVFRVFKRCKIQENILRKLLSSLGTVADNHNVVDESQSEVLSLRDDSIHKSNDDYMKHLVSRGKQLLKERSVLYKTPIKQMMHEDFNTKKVVPLSRLVHLRNMQFSHSRITNETTFDLQITDILDNLTALSSSISNN